MRIVIATGIYPPEVGGPATYAVLVEEGLRARGWSVEVLPFRIVRHLPPVIRHFAFTYRLWKATKGVDVIFAQDTVSVGLPARIVAKLRRLPLVIRVPGDFAWEQGVQRFGVKEDIDHFQSRSYGWRVELLRWIQCFVVRGADQVIAPSQYFAALVGGWVQDRSRVQAIYNGVALPGSISATVFSGPTLVTAARLVPWKRIDLLIQALTLIPDAQLLVIGEGPDRSRLEQLVKDLRVERRVQFTGPLPRTELINHIAGCDLFLLASAFESFSFQLVEAMMVGATVVACDVGNLREIITPDVNGILLSQDPSPELYAKTIQSLLVDPARRKRLGGQAIIDSQRFSVSAVVEALEGVLKKVALLS